MTVGSLFAGIGGFELAAQWAGFTPVWSNEIDPFCCQVLRKNFKHRIIEDDIRNIGKHNLEPVDILTGGFPCQKYSHAGFRHGNEPLAIEMLRVIGETRPRYVVAENVYGFITIDAGKSLQSFCSDLQDLGYEEPAVLDFASDFAGLQTMERHVWIVSKANGVGLKRNLPLEIQGVGQNPRELQGTSEGIGGGRDIRESRFLRVGERTSRKIKEVEKVVD